MILTEPTENEQFHTPGAPIFAVVAAILLIAGFLITFGVPFLGHWLVREDPIHPVDAIAVLSGMFPQRAIEAAQLYGSGYAREVWLTYPKNRGGSKEPEDERNYEVLRSFGVPEESIRVLDTPIVNTADELNAIGSWLKESGDRSVIIVTNKAHTRRVYSLWDKYHAGDGEILVHGLPGDAFSPGRWWRSASSRAEAIHELLGMLDVWAGLPVHRPLQKSA
jgi:uncharacterized SAM-binding protein YcdF (DUF218 family)